MQFYTAVVIVSILSLTTILIHLSNTELIPSSKVKSFFCAYALILVGAVAEWCGVYCNNTGTGLSVIHAFIKAAEYSLSPAIILLFANLFDHFKNVSKKKLLIYLIGVNSVLEFASVWLGLIFYIDSDNIYHRGELYWIYIAVTVVCLAVFCFEAVYNSRNYQNADNLTLISSIVMLVAGIVFQMLNNEVRTLWLCSAISGILFFVYFTDLYLQEDELTGLLNRTCYEKFLSTVSFPTAVIMFDVDDFKSVNDNYGHAYGDKILKCISRCIRNAYGSRGYCYRIGGDEFCVILKKGRLGQPLTEEEMKDFPHDFDIPEMPEPTKAVFRMNYRFNELLLEARTAQPLLPDVSLGYEFYNGSGAVDLTVHKADMLMYEKKKRRKEFRDRASQPKKQ